MYGSGWTDQHNNIHSSSSNHSRDHTSAAAAVLTSLLVGIEKYVITLQAPYTLQKFCCATFIQFFSFHYRENGVYNYFFNVSSQYNGVNELGKKTNQDYNIPFFFV